MKGPMNKDDKALGIPSVRTNGQGQDPGGTSRRQNADGDGNLDVSNNVLNSNGILDYNRRYGF